MSGKRKPSPEADTTNPPQKKLSRPTTTPQPRKNTAVYVTNLPRDVTVAEIDSVFSRFGLIAEDLATGEKRIKLYTEDDGKTLKGDALVVYFKSESVSLAVDMLDETEFRLGKQSTGEKIHVQPADMNYKVEKEPQPVQQRSAREKRELQQRAQKMNNKLAAWDDEELELIEEQQRQNNALAKRFSKVVILKHVFTLKELEEDITAALDIKEDIREGCEEIGPVTSVILYDLERDGVMSVRFQKEEDAKECVRRMDGRFFSGRRLEAALYDGLARYKKSGKKSGATDEDGEKEEEERLKKFGEWLESGAADAEDEGEWHDD
ncbi:hypothetical protein BZA70DRAFT_194110 [Myxozyma melibiosi]|uniref:RRM domain-containing protein n=1 Tax=Myxozyma melibiosi TaxID=54550 RepID=A0ABR1F3U5_9ASCO